MSSSFSFASVYTVSVCSCHENLHLYRHAISCLSRHKLLCGHEDRLKRPSKAFLQGKLAHTQTSGFHEVSNASQEIHICANALSEERFDVFHGSSETSSSLSQVQLDVFHIERGALSEEENDGCASSPSQVPPHLRIDALDMQRDYRNRPLRPLLDVDKPIPKYPAKPGKRQNVPPKARKMILQLREVSLEDFGESLKRCTYFKPDRADWLYVLRFFREREDKSMLLQVYDFVLLEPAFRAGTRDYTNLILVYAQLKNKEAVEMTLKIMAEREVFPDLVTFTAVIGMYGKLGNYNMVKTKFCEAKLWGLVPDMLMYCAVIEAYCQLGHACEAELLLQDMELEEIPSKIEIFISLIRGYGLIGHIHDAERIFQLMQAKLFYPERRSYSALMDAYTKDEDVRHAFEVFDNMVKVGIEPTDRALARLLTVCEKKNMIAEVTRVIETLQSKSLKFGTRTLISFRGWLEKLGMHKEAEPFSLEIESRLRRKAYLEKKWPSTAYVRAT